MVECQNGRTNYSFIFYFEATKLTMGLLNLDKKRLLACEMQPRARDVSLLPTAH